MDALTLIREIFAPLAEKTILDIGCGTGILVRTLTESGARVVGLDPGREALARARALVPTAQFEEASAEAIPFAEHHFDGAVMLNSLHHVPTPARALAEAARVLTHGGRLVVVEPSASGTFFDALKPIEDETEIRALAQQAIADAIASGAYACERDLTLERTETFPNIEAFFQRVTAVDPARSEAIRERRKIVEAAFAQAAERGADGRFTLVQPLRIHVLTPSR